ncbi:Peptidase S28 protein [Raphanus sativus]|nr:Peptidase S28 protein [Raphanus sativus]
MSLVLAKKFEAGGVGKSSPFNSLAAFDLAAFKYLSSKQAPFDLAAFREYYQASGSLNVKLNRTGKVDNPWFFFGASYSGAWKLRMDNETAMDLNDTDYMSGDELMDQNSDGDEDEAVAVDETLMSTASAPVKRGDEVEELGEEVKEKLD